MQLRLQNLTTQTLAVSNASAGRSALAVVLSAFQTKTVDYPFTLSIFLGDATISRLIATKSLSVTQAPSAVSNPTSVQSASIQQTGRSPYRINFTDLNMAGVSSAYSVTVQGDTSAQLQPNSSDALGFSVIGGRAGDLLYITVVSQ